MRAVGRFFVGFGIGRGLAVRHAESGAHFKFGIHGFYGAKRLGLRNVHHVRGAHALDKICARRRVGAVGITQESKDPRLIENAPMLDAVAQRARDDFRYSVKRPARSRFGQPPASSNFCGKSQ